MTIALIITFTYVVVIWIVFFRLRLLKFNIVWGVVSFWIGVHLLLIFIIGLRFFQPYSIDGHVIRKTVQIIPRLTQPTLLVDVLVEQNTPVKRGQPLYQFDRTVFEAKLREQQANLVEAQQQALILEQDVKIANDALLQAQANEAFAQEQVNRYSDLVPKGGAKRETLDQWIDQLAGAEAQVSQAEANEEKAALALDAQINGVNVGVLAAQAKVEQAQYFLDQTTLRAPADGIIVSQQAWPGLVVGEIRLGAIATLILDEGPYLLASFYQEHLKFVDVGQEAEVALDLYPGQIFKAKVEQVWLGTGQGQIKPSGNVPTFRFPKLQGRFAVQIRIDDPALKQLPAGAHGAVAIYTGRGQGFAPLRRINIRLYSWANFLFPLDFL